MVYTVGYALHCTGDVQSTFLTERGKRLNNWKILKQSLRSQNTLNACLDKNE